MSKSTKSNGSSDSDKVKKDVKYVVKAFHSKIHNPVKLDDELGDPHTTLFDDHYLKKVDRPYK
jgi:hypothetical protein